MLSPILVLVTLVGFSSAAALPGVCKKSTPEDFIQPIKKRSDGIDPHTALEQTIFHMSSPAHSLGSDGTCSSSADWSGGCNAYCEETEEWFYGPETPYADSFCTGAEVCQLAEAQAVTVTNSWTFNSAGTLGLKRDVEEKRDDSTSSLTATFNAGAAYTYSISVAYTTTETFTRPTDVDGFCGYWTFVPYYIQSCGSIAWGSVEFYPCGGGQCIDQGNAYTCNNTPYKDSNGHTDGVTLFITVNCTTNERLPEADQSAGVWQIYSQPGVASGQVPSKK